MTIAKPRADPDGVEYLACRRVSAGGIRVPAGSVVTVQQSLAVEGYVRLRREGVWSQWFFWKPVQSSFVSREGGE